MATNIILVAATLLFVGLLFHPRIRKARLWRATVTPLASIIGSGFLVAGPVLANTTGQLAWLAMASLCGLAYLFGAAIRYNIGHFESRPEDQRLPLMSGLERVSEVALALAYFVSVAYYLNLFAAFGLRFGNIVDPLWINIAATIVIAVLGCVGALGGLKALERLEVDAVALKLAVIFGLFVALTCTTILSVFQGDFGWPNPPHERGLVQLQTLLGLVILVQGFETSRYLGAEYKAEVRIRTMRWAQWISSAIYILFILLITRYFTRDLPKHGGETAIVDMLAPVGAVVGPVIMIAALASQSSAAIADINGAGGLLAEALRKRVSVKIGNAIAAAAAIAIIWLANIYEIITYASKAFVAYYALQSLLAAVSASRKKHYGHAALFSAMVLIALAIVVFATPVET